MGRHSRWGILEGEAPAEPNLEGQVPAEPFPTDTVLGQDCLGHACRLAGTLALQGEFRADTPVCPYHS